jgi:hypothetical protein
MKPWEIFIMNLIGGKGLIFYSNKKSWSNLRLGIKKVPPQGAGYGKRFARKPLVSIASLYFPPQEAGNYTQIIIKVRCRRHTS